MQLISAPLQVTCMRSSLFIFQKSSFGDTDTKFAESHSSENYEILLMFRQAVTGRKFSKVFIEYWLTIIPLIYIS